MKADVLSLIIGVHGTPDISLHNQSHLDENTFPPPELQLPTFFLDLQFVEISET